MARRASLAVVAAVSGAVLVAGVTTAATAAPASLVSETFTGATPDSTSWVLPGHSGATSANDACLTASSNTSQTPLPGCAGSAGDATGLQLTPNANDQQGGVAYTSSVPSSLGLDVRFTSYQYAGDAADGIVFFLAASDPTNAATSPITLGPPGGNLSYSARTADGIPGLTNGYLGVGLDVYGNYTASDFAGSGCTDTAGQTPDSVTVRGPGSGTAGYCVQTTKQVTSGSLHSSTSQPEPVEVAINPTADPLTTSSTITVPAHSYTVVVTPVGGTPITESAGLPDASGFLPDSWVDSNGVPHQLSFGWGASTGGSTDFHTISDVQVDTLNGTPPALGVSLSDNSGGTGHVGDTVVYSATTTISNADESKPITLTDTFPAQLAPQAAGLGGTAAGTTWACQLNGQTVTCTHPAAPIGTLDAVHLPVVVAAAATNLDDTVTVAASDATQGTATDTRSYAAAPSATTLSFVGEPVNSQINAVMTNPNATTTHVRVAAETTGGAVDSGYDGTVTLSFSSGTTGSPQFVVGGSSTPTLTATAQNGIADFSPIVVDSAGFGDRLEATADGLAAATSDPFDVSAAATACPAGQTCTAAAGSPSAGLNALVKALPGDDDAIISATFGGDVAPIYPCRGSSDQILTFSGDRQKLITLTLKTKHPTVFFCFGQPTPFITLTMRLTTHYNPVNHDYEGLLPPCLRGITGPCIKALTLSKGVETVVIASNSADPHIMQ